MHFKKLVFILMLFFCFKFAMAQNSTPSYVWIKPSVQASIFSAIQLQKYQQAKDHLDFYINQNGFVSLPECLKYDYFYDVFGEMSECTCSEFNRKTVPIRTILEHKLAENFKGYKMYKKDQIIYTSVGSGFLFEDLIIITILLVLLKDSPTNIVVNLIDERYKNFVRYARQCLGYRNIPFVVSQIPSQLVYTIADAIDLNNGIFYFFLKWFEFLRTQFKKKWTLDVLIYDKLDSYFKDCNEHHNEKSDIGVIIDFDGDFGTDETLDPVDLFVEYLHPFYCEFFEHGIKDNGLYGFALFGNFQNCSLKNFTGGPIWTKLVPRNNNPDEVEEKAPIACFCGKKSKSK